jgi:putative copper export protein
VLPVSTDTIRLFLHVLAATIWVGGQLTLAGLVPGLRALNAGAPRAVARRFNRIAWPAFAVLVATGVWNVLAEHVGDKSTAYQVTLFLKLVVVAVSGVSAAMHMTAKSKWQLALFGALGALAAVGALFVGVLLAHSS